MIMQGINFIIKYLLGVNIDKKNPGKERLLGLAGSMVHDDFLEIEKTLEDTERIYPHEWQHS